MNGKGDTPRPRSVDAETYARNWERTFGSPLEALANKIDADIVGAATMPALIRGQTFVIYEPSFSTQFSRSALKSVG